MAGNANSISSHNSLRGSLSENNLVSGTVDTAYDPTYAIVTEAAAQVVLNINNLDYKMSIELKDKNGNHISTSNTIDLPLETMVVNGEYDDDTKEIILTLDNGNEIVFSVADLVAGLVSTTDYATANTGGVIKTSGTYANETSSTGLIRGITKTYQQYGSLDNAAFISKGTLENVITGKELVNKSVNNLTNYYTITQIDNMLGDINEVIDLINGEVV